MSLMLKNPKRKANYNIFFLKESRDMIIISIFLLTKMLKYLTNYFVIDLMSYDNSSFTVLLLLLLLRQPLLLLKLLLLIKKKFFNY